MINLPFSTVGATKAYHADCPAAMSEDKGVDGPPDPAQGQEPRLVVILPVVFDHQGAIHLEQRGELKRDPVLDAIGRVLGGVELDLHLLWLSDRLSAVESNRIYNQNAVNASTSTRLPIRKASASRRKGAAFSSLSPAVNSSEKRL